MEEDIRHQLESAEGDLGIVRKRLEAEFATKNLGADTNPLLLLQRLKRLQDAVPQLASDAAHLQELRQELVQAERAAKTSAAVLNAAHQENKRPSNGVKPRA